MGLCYNPLWPQAPVEATLRACRRAGDARHARDLRGLALVARAARGLRTGLPDIQNPL
jgi:hypothetical protein